MTPRIAFLFVLGLFSPVFGDQVASTQFKGLNNNTSSVIIEPEFAQDLLNVDVTPGGKSVKKRSGYGLYKALLTAKPMRGGFHSFDSTGNDVQIWGSSTSLYGIVADATPTQLVSSATLNSTWDCADTQGNSYCVNSNRDTYLLTNGATKTWYPAPLGTMVESTPDRVVVAGVSGSPNTLYVSQSNTFTNFVTGVNATDAFTEVIASPGSKLTHIRYGCGKLLWWKDQSFGYFDFDDQYQAQVKTVSDTIGTFDNTSAIDPGGRVWFRGQDGHTWMYDCSFLTKQSIDITPNVQISGRRISNSWTQSSASDFGGGLGYATFTDTTTVPGSVILNGIENQFSSTATWTSSSGTWSISGGTSVSAPSGSFGTGISSYLRSSTNSISSAFYAKSSVLINSGSFGSGTACIGAINSISNGYWACLAPGGVPPQTYVLWITTNPAAIGGASVDTGIAINSSFHTIDFSRAGNGVLSATFDGTTSTNAINSLYGNLGQAVLFSNSGFDAVGSKFDYVYVKTSTGVYYSSVHNAPNITTWSTLGVNYQNNDGSHSFFLRSSTNSFTAASSTPAWTSQTAGNLITISTGTYFQFADTFSVTAATQAPTLNDFSFNWFEGSAGDQAYMLYFDNAIWQSVAFGSGQSANNYIFKYDLINEGWTLYNFGAGGLLVQSNTLYFGDTSAGNVFNYGTSTSDNGSAINSFWRSKSFTGNDPFLQSALTNIDIFAKKDNGTTLTATYTLDTSTAMAYSVNLSTSNSIVQSRKLLPSGKLGYAFDFKLGDTSSSSAWEILGFRIGFNQQPYRPTQ